MFIENIRRFADVICSHDGHLVEGVVEALLTLKVENSL
jgi:hypothetical protein